MIIYALLKSFFSGWWNTWRTRKRDVCEGVSFVTLLLSYVWLFLLSPTRGGSDSIAPRDSLPVQRWKDPSSLHTSIHAGDKSGVRAEPLLIQTFSDCPHADPELKGGKGSNTSGRFVHSPKVKVLYAKKNTFKPCLFLCLCTSTHSSMFTPWILKGKSIKNTWNKREREKAEDRKMFFLFCKAQTKHSIYFLNSHSLTFIRCRVACRCIDWMQREGGKEGKRGTGEG